LSFSLAALALIGASGCGGSTHHASTTRTVRSLTLPPPPTPTATTSTAATTTTTSSPATTASSTPITTATTTTTGTTTHSSGGAGINTTRTTATNGGSTNARIPATFILTSAGRLSPPVITAPAFLAVQLAVISRDGRAHHFVLRAPGTPMFTVPAHGRGSVLVRGLRAGHYALLMDGKVAGGLTIGGEPGP
jgi:hypothetical protein